MKLPSFFAYNLPRLFHFQPSECNRLVSFETRSRKFPLQTESLFHIFHPRSWILLKSSLSQESARAVVDGEIKMFEIFSCVNFN